MVKVLFIDDDINLQKIFKMILPKEYRLISAYNGSHGLSKINEENPDVILLDINLPDMDGIRVLKEIKNSPAPPPVIMVSALRETELIVSAMKAGAYNYIIKSEDDNFEKIRSIIKQAVLNSPIRKSDMQPNQALERIIGESRIMKDVKELVAIYASNDSVVLIEGDSGTGKEVIASTLHDLSDRYKAPFIPINCGAIPENLIETTLFGSEKGAFTGAISTTGYFEKADKGTLFLDEIGEMSLSAQVKLLRVLETNEIERVGGNRRISVNVRVITATNRNLREEVAARRFREDLFYRLDVLRITLPSLKERLEDIPLLAAYMIQTRFQSDKRLTEGAVEKLKSHFWPGNIRELRNVMERGILLSGKNNIAEEHIKI